MKKTVDQLTVLSAEGDILDVTTWGALSAVYPVCEQRGWRIVCANWQYDLYDLEIRVNNGVHVGLCVSRDLLLKAMKMAQSEGYFVVAVRSRSVKEELA